MCQSKFLSMIMLIGEQHCFDLFCGRGLSSCTSGKSCVCSFSSPKPASTGNLPVLPKAFGPNRSFLSLPLQAKQHFKAMAGSSGSAAETTTVPGYNAGNSGPSEGHRCHYRGAERAAGTEPSPPAHSLHCYQCVSLTPPPCSKDSLVPTEDKSITYGKNTPFLLRCLTVHFSSSLQVTT